MKKVLFMLVVVLIGTGCYAQKKNVSQAKNKAMAAENPDFTGARALIGEALEDETTKNLADTWYWAGMIGYKENEYLLTQSILTGKVDDKKKGEAVVESYNYFVKADEIAMTPTINKKGKEVVDTKTHKNIQAKMLDYYTSQELVKYGIWLNDQRDFANAYEVFKMHTDIPELKMMQDEKMQAKMPRDTTYNQYLYYTGLFATQAGMHPEAIAIFERMKDGDYEPITVNQFLYQEYVEMKDTANFVRVLQNAIEKFPAEPWFLQNLINFYIFSGQEQTAIEYLDKAIEREPNVAQYYHIRGNLKENAKMYEEALADFDKALAIDPTLADAVAGKGRVYYNQAVKMNEDAAYISDNKQYQKALKEMDEVFAKSLPFFEQAHELDKENRNYMIILKQLYYRLKMDKKYEEINNLLNQ